MSVWEKGLKQALLGTTKTEPLEVPHGKLGEFLETFQGKNEEKLLLGMSLAGLATRNQIQIETGLPALEIAPEDPRPLCTKKQIEAFSRIHNDPWLRPLLPLWLKQISVSGLRLPTKTLIEVLNLGMQNPDLRQQIYSVISSKGFWLAAQNPAWKYVWNPALAATEIWPEASSRQRIEVLKFHEAPLCKERFALLKKSWPTEKSSDRAAQLEALHLFPNQALESWLETALDDRSLEVRRSAQKRLAQCKGSAYRHRMTERAKAFISLKKADEISIQLPRAEDLRQDWERDGLILPEKVTPHARAQILADLLSVCPPQTWSQNWQIELHEVYSLFAQAAWQDLTLPAFWKGLLASQDQAAIEALLFPIERAETFLETAPLAELLSSLPIARREFWLELAFKDLQGTLRKRLRQEALWSFEWGAHLSEMILESLLQVFLESGPLQENLTSQLAPLLLRWGHFPSLQAFWPKFSPLQLSLQEREGAIYLRGFLNLLKFRIETLEA
ncbi:hypothetical protein COW36_18975 [bacterium (Candidatus Blackallbacteria) CG17_big_fil_post_rev_8_21_14_2_50_48_46]|uniref:Uncharacterized protein n=1 Tax=bacterium (Candidatus Blackallbacteria) CG17_big_fil_post_rev_8_21_14_2_50_48_46 TaxID=2014261 RepID=A0A2M7G0B1_9BACT|nr:MAG: hypothetical protein COW64_25495 [bacterium (Candidatus Blackallbacteria) CG18_big_fil_WC_8_21_14_2_50_49_26]PIW15011.1 MAG: hypothetical protein COW36_18975 [bacterium (Candidatus Blackallbacteria) CG17_big_fil_post_rev_8_21_14_2_50_48_46]PIW50092.1 MAG: hypothetical protein COW20_03910 [bacterium (Candidatus Blackallbacteria) CG13_big_fil_rev_8_21_14_2_50_49_14]